MSTHQAPGQSSASQPFPSSSSHSDPGNPAAWLAPCAITASADGETLFVAEAKAQRIDLLDCKTGRITRQIHIEGEPSGLVLAPNGGHLYITCAAPHSRVYEIDLVTGTISKDWKTGQTALSPVLSPDAKTLYVCLRFDCQIAAFDLENGREARRIPVGREPVSAVVTGDGQYLLVAHHLPSGRADVAPIAATVGVVTLAKASMERELRLPNGSSLLRQIQLSPDGKHAAVAHNLGHYQVPTTQVERGWMNTSALTLIETTPPAILSTVLLDDVDRGAANPWAVAWSADGQRLLVTHAGTHELSVINFSALLAKLAGLRAKHDTDDNPVDDLAFMEGLHQRIKLAGNGPRTATIAGQSVCIADYFSDTVEMLNPSKSYTSSRIIRLQPETAESISRKGERLFNDASIGFQGWQSCATCHSEDARIDGLNWDLLNDGIGTPKNTKSLVLSHVTPPAMSTGIRYNGEVAVRAGIQHILFATPSEELAAPIDHWLKSLKPIPSPHLVDGRFSPAAKRGERIFKSARTGCATCHPQGLFTNMQTYDVGTASFIDQGVSRFDTPTLRELWRTAPYLHDGSAATVRDVLTTRNAEDRHGRVSQLSETDLNDLVEYLLSI